MSRSSRLDAPIAAQILALLAVSLVAAQLVTLVLSALLPPPPSPQYRIADIAAALRGGPLRADGRPPLQRAVQQRPPDVLSPGWQVAGPSQRALAAALGVEVADVRLLFYSPPPFAAGNPRTARAEPGQPRFVEASIFAPLLMAPPPMGAGAGAGGGPGGGGWPGAQGAGPDGQGPPGTTRGQGRTGGPSTTGRAGAGAAEGAPGSPQVFDPPVTPVVRGAPDGGPSGAVGAGGFGAQEHTGAPAVARPPNADGPIPTAPHPASAFPPGVGPPIGAAPVVTSLPQASLSQNIENPPVATGPAFGPTRRPSSDAVTKALPSQSPPPDRIAAAASLAASSPSSTSSSSPGARRSTEPLAPPVDHTLFGLARTPVVEGQFLAALQVAPDRWVTVRPQQTWAFSPWQRRLGLWFLLAFAAVAPAGYVAGRRLAAPLADLADAADRLGRDPATAIPLAGGALEIRRLASALASMQGRLQRHVADRTAMVGAISHDLRTPLARLRFKLERAPPVLKASMSRDLDQMEEMLNAVLLFIRDASEPGPRQLVDLRSILECVVDDAALVGGDVTLAPGEPAPVEVDILSVQRVLTNLVDNALKYGAEARVGLTIRAGEAIVDVADAGPGLVESEREKVFEPFYRSEHGRRLSAQGIGLGLSVSRSITRAHGGDIVLRAGSPGLVAELRLPLAQASMTEPVRRTPAIRTAAA